MFEGVNQIKLRIFSPLVGGHIKKLVCINFLFIHHLNIFIYIRDMHVITACEVLLRPAAALKEKQSL